MLHHEVSLWMVLPFGLLLASMAAGPVLFPSWWSRHYAKFALTAAGLILFIYLTKSWQGQIVDTGLHYFSFIVLIGSLYVVSGGIHFTLQGQATPAKNILFLLSGAIAANFLGTTGASVLLIRPWLHFNRERLRGYHVVFFIFIISNVGGCLTPIGDPPLFLGYLMGVPFWWVTLHCWPIWLVGVSTLLVFFYILDRKNSVSPLPAGSTGSFRIEGKSNLVFLAIIIGAVFIQNIGRELLMLAGAAGSYWTTPKKVHHANHFTLHPLAEVAVLFLGLFFTMMPALDWLQAHAARFSSMSPGLTYATSGTLSSVLDNAPTYWSFFTILPISGPARETALLALSIGSVFFGANTYIGNGPNLLVKAIADHQKVPTPDFFNYFLRYTLPFMAPMLLLVWWLFFSR